MKYSKFTEFIFNNIDNMDNIYVICFIVTSGTQQCRGFGYVTFAMEDDALQAVKEVKSYDGKRISVSVAKKKIHEKRKPGT